MFVMTNRLSGERKIEEKIIVIFIRYIYQVVRGKVRSSRSKRCLFFDSPNFEPKSFIHEKVFLTYFLICLYKHFS